MLDRRVLDLAFGLPGQVRRPKSRADKHLLRKAFPELLRPALLSQQKRGFTLPVGRWLLGPLHDLCVDALQALKSSGLLRPAGIDAIWNSFRRSGDGLRWSRPFSLVVLGSYLRRLGESRRCQS
jgi:asparagine synthase (glutamine-hydrolysing)